MKWMRFLLLALLLPILCSAHSEHYYIKNYNHIINEYNKAYDLMSQVQNLGPDQTDLYIQLITETAFHYSQAASLCDKLIHKARKESYGISDSLFPTKRDSVNDLKNRAQAEKNTYLAQSELLLKLAQDTRAGQQASILYAQSIATATSAKAAIEQCPPNLFNGPDVVNAINASADLYAAAANAASRALSLLASSGKEEDKAALQEMASNYEQAAHDYRKQAAEWPQTALVEKEKFFDHLASLKAECQRFEAQHLFRSSYVVQNQEIAPLIEHLIQTGPPEVQTTWQQELDALKNQATLFEKPESGIINEDLLLLPQQELSIREHLRRTHFFKSPVPFLSLQNEAPRSITPLDGQRCINDSLFLLYAQQSYRFLVHCASSPSQLVVRVDQDHEERIPLPEKNTPAWESLVSDGFLMIPPTSLPGHHLQIQFCSDALIITHHADDPMSCSVAFDEAPPLYSCTFLEPPPWQLETLRKPAFSISEPSGSSSSFSLTKPTSPASAPEPNPLLDAFVQELKQDPLAIAQYVQNEIAFFDPILHQEEGLFYSPGIQQKTSTTLQTKQGSPWEQCQLLVELLRRAGHMAVYATGDCLVPRLFAEHLLLTHLAEDVSLHYPLVLFWDGDQWISLFPWMKNIQLHEGYDLYQFLPDDYACAHRWITHYLNGDEAIFKFVGPEENDTAGVLFGRFVENALRENGTNLNDVGIHCTPIKRQFSSWDDFPRPTTIDRQSIDLLEPADSLYAISHVTFFSQAHPEQKLSYDLRLDQHSSIPIHSDATSLHVQIADRPEDVLSLEPSDMVGVSVACDIPVGSSHVCKEQTFWIPANTIATLCMHAGLASEETFTKTDAHAFLAKIAAAYFDRCTHAEEFLAHLHKTRPNIMFKAGIAQVVGDHQKSPQLNMVLFHAPTAADPAQEALNALVAVDSSSNEHQILREVFGDPHAISTVKLLQMAHLSGKTVSVLTARSDAPASLKPDQWELIQKTLHTGSALDDWAIAYLTPADSEIGALILHPEAQEAILSNHSIWIHGGDASYMPTSDTSTYTKNFLPDSTYTLNSSTYSMTYVSTPIIPILTYTPVSLSFPQDQSTNWTMPSSLDPTLPSSTYTSQDPSNWSFPSSLSSTSQASTDSSLSSLNVSSLQTPLPVHSSLNFSSQQTPISIYASTLFNVDHAQINPIVPTSQTSDVRSGFKSPFNKVSDPIDVVTGAFYVDDADLILPGIFPLEIRRNYNSQNSLPGDFGYGWKLGLNPTLVNQDGKLYAAEMDGTVIVYRLNAGTSRWEVFPEDNPELCNLGINPFQAYIENDVLHGSDGSQRIFENGLLQKWINARGNTLSFSYQDKQLKRIESSSGAFCTFHTNPDGKISEIYAQDGRRIAYAYSSQGDLVTVTLPNSGTILYEYDRFHRIIRETRPNGNVLENSYDEKGRVIRQRSPVGPQQEMLTSATFAYAENGTSVTDAGGGTTVYQIHDKLITQITDPLGLTTFQSWFIDAHSPGAFPRSLQSSIDKRGLKTDYLYDDRGNLVEVRLQGEDLTGDGQTLAIKKMTYNENNLCIREETPASQTTTIYDERFPFLPKRVETLQSTSEYSYNDLGLVEEENHAGSITRWSYDTRGFPVQAKQLTGTDDPDVVTSYVYNHQGQCIQKTIADSIEHNDYDIMGNNITSQTFSLSRKLLFAESTGYDLNNRPIWKKSANAQSLTFFDYNAAGQLKATRRTLYPTSAIAYTLYSYDSRGNLIEEVDPLGHCTYRDYDLLGRVVQETIADQTTSISYEAGGLLNRLTSPSNASLKHRYTTNGLLLEEVAPDGTKSSFIYDLLGRPVSETRNGMTWTIEYNDHRIIRRHNEITEIQELDSRGNLIRETDAAGNITSKTYDNLNRLVSQTTPCGETTTWSYQNDRVIRTAANHEQTIQTFAGNRLVHEETLDPQGTVIASASFEYDPVTDRQITTRGSETTISWMNAFNLPIKEESGDLTTIYEYDACGCCIQSTDGENRTTRQSFDALGRVIQKTLPDGAELQYFYDLDSNLIETLLPNGSLWRASYDSMKRKCSEELVAEGNITERWEYTYEEGLLTQVKDSLGRIHTYSYDSLGRQIAENIDGYQRTYIYDPRGLLTSAQENDSLVQRAYDADGRIIEESIFLNGALMQQTHQIWTPSTRTLQIADHERTFTYQNQQLVQLSSKEISLSYAYDQGRVLASKKTPLSTTLIESHPSALPKTITTILPHSSSQESLEWDRSGKLSHYSAPRQQHRFTYTSRGFLQSTGTESYEFDFGQTGTGVCTAAPDWHVPDDGLDSFGAVVTEIDHAKSFSCSYDALGQTITRSSRTLEWDPFGRLIKVVDPSFVWEAIYDAFGRRLETHTSWCATALTTSSFYDPEGEFEEIGVQYDKQTVWNFLSCHCDKQTFWKFYGPTSCDAISDDTEAFVILTTNALGQLTEVTSPQETFVCSDLPTAFGAQGNGFEIPSDLLTYAQSLTWHSKAQDPTGLIWMGARYYDPRAGRFLSPDPVGYPICIDRYAYANGDPINYIDPDGRFFSHAYDTTKATVINTISSPYFQGSMQVIMGSAEVGAGYAMAAGGLLTAPFGGFAAIPLGGLAMAHGSDHLAAGLETLIRGQHTNTMTNRILQNMGMSPGWADIVDNSGSMGFTMGGAGAVRALQMSTFANYSLPINSIEPVTLNRFHHATSQLSEVGQDNIRILRGWAKSKGWEKLPNPAGTPEKWGVYQNNQFEWRLRIKPEPGFREELNAGSKVARFDARLGIGGKQFINPFTGEIGGTSVGRHIPIEFQFLQEIK